MNSKEEIDIERNYMLKDITGTDNMQTRCKTIVQGCTFG